MNSNYGSFQPTKLTVWGSILLMACTHSVSMAEAGGADTAKTNHDQSTHQTKDTQAKVESRPQPESRPAEPESRPEGPQESVTEQSPVTHTPKARDDASLSKTDHVEPSTPVETKQKEIALSTLSRNTDPVETPAGPMLVAMAEQPPAVTPGQYNKIC